MVGITICIVIRLQESVVACVLQPWSGGKDPDRYIKGASSEVTGRSTLLCEARWTPFGLTGRKYNQPQRTTVCRLCSSPTSLIVALKLQAVHRSPSPQVAHMHVRRFLDDERPAHCPSSYVKMPRVCCTLQKLTDTEASRATSVGPTADAAPRAGDSTNQAGWDASGGSVEAGWLRTKWGTATPLPQQEVRYCAYARKCKQNNTAPKCNGLLYHLYA
jgi:hypothetical protein